MGFQHFPFITLVFLAYFPSINGENTNFTACSIPYSCGNIQNIKYPFWGENRPKFCGIPEFKLNCLDDDNGEKKSIMYVFGYKYLGLSVTTINTSSHTIGFSLEELFKRCYYLNASNISYLPVLKPGPMYKNISIFYGCNHTEVSRFDSKYYHCSDNYDGLKIDNGNGTAFYFENESDIRKICKLNLCKNNIKFLLHERGVEELRRNNTSLEKILMDKPIEANYTANFSDCFECEKSGGRCGSLGDFSSAKFVCYCKDGMYSLMCQSDKRKLRLILGLGISGGILLVVVAIVVAFQHSKKLTSCSRRASLDTNLSDLQNENILFSVPLFSYNQLAEATDNFNQSNVLGDGGFGIVYYGKLKDGREVAVKCLYEKNFKRVEQFMNEVELLTCLRHQNLVSLYGCTSHKCKELLLVYEFVKNGTVSDHLYGDKSKSGFLPWPIRLKIAIETACALSYLHASDIIHRDVKTSNILLDSNFGVKVVDFGLSRLFPIDVTHVSTAPQGTPGYLDPEYFQCYQLTDKSDVYSFGVVLIELISSLPAVDLERSRQEINLSNYAMNKIQRCAFDELVDPQLGFTTNSEVRRMITFVAELAFRCLQHDREFRPSMDEVFKGLKSIESADYKSSLEVELAKKDRDLEGAKDNRGKVVKLHITDQSPSPAKDDHVGLLSSNRFCSSSPISVMNKWVSTSTTPSVSK